MTTVLALGLAAAQTLGAPGAVQWEEVGSDPGGRYAVAPASIARDGDTVRVLVRATAARAEADGVDVALVRYRIDCRRRTSLTEATDFYRGEAFAYAREPEEEQRPAQVGETGVELAMFQRVCGVG